jgi:hypothetical protein
MKTVLINAAGVVVDPADRVVHVSKNGNEELRWVATGGGGPWRITFDKTNSGSPFTDTSYDVPAGGSKTTSGGPVAGVVGRSYQYNVRNPAALNPPTDDPDVDVDP